MTNFLQHFFLPMSPESPGYRSAAGRLAGWVGIFCNVLLFACKLAAGLLSGSLSIVADAVNNLSDAASSVITLLGFHLSRRPPDKDHPYGHARIEYLSGLAVSVMILLIGLELGVSSVRKILSPTPVEFSLLSFGILLASIAVKYWMCRFFHTLGRQIDSTVLEATALDSRNDFLVTAAVLSGCLFTRYFRINIDGWVGLGLAVFIFWSGIGVAGDTVSPLLGPRADPELVQKLTELVLSQKKVLGIHDLLVHDYGPGQCFASLHAELSAQEDPLQCHDLIDRMECEALSRLQVHLVIHWDPVETDDAQRREMEQLLSSVISAMDPRFSFHDFRLVRGSGQPRLVFDLAIPYDCTATQEEISAALSQSLHEYGKDYPLTVRFDRVP